MLEAGLLEFRTLDDHPDEAEQGQGDRGARGYYVRTDLNVSV